MLQSIRESWRAMLKDEGLDVALEQALPGNRTVESILDDRRQSRRLTTYQKQQIQAGRADGLVCDEYVIRDVVGAGEQAIVYLANHNVLRRLDALKIVRPEMLESLSEAQRQQTMTRFKQGARAAARLYHENIVRTYGFSSEHFYVAMEFVDGPDLDLLSDLAPLTVRDAVNYILQAARGLDYAHTCDPAVIHRDIKPRNLLFEEKTHTVKIADWGMARIMGSDSQPTYSLRSVGGPADCPSTRPTCAGEVFGTVCFMSPEQAMDSGQADARSDIYSLGCTLFTLLTRRPVYERSTATMTMLAHCDESLSPPSLADHLQRRSERESQGGVGVATRFAFLDKIFHRMVARRPRDRYQSMEEVIAALDDFQDGASFDAS